MAATITEEKPAQTNGSAASPTPDNSSEKKTEPETPAPKQDSEATEDSEKKSSEYDDVVIETEQLGIYRLLVATTNNKRKSYQKNIEELRSSIPHLITLFRDIYTLSPWLFSCVLVWKVWGALQEALLMQMSTNMLRLVEAGLTTGKPFVSEVLWALAMRTVFSALMSYLNWYSRKLESRFRGMVTGYFELKLMEVKLHMDIPTSLDATSNIEVSGDDAWSAYRDILSYLSNALTAASQVMVLSNQARASGDPLFVFICLLKPIFSSLSYRALWEKVCYAYVSNSDYIRMSSLKMLGGREYKEDVLSGDLGSWIIREYRSARDKLGEIPVENPFVQYYNKESVFTPMVNAVLEDLPTAYCGINAVLYPARFSIASLAIFQSSSLSLRYSVEDLFRGGQDFQKNLQSIKQIYSTKEIKNKIMDGKVAYAPLTEKGVESPGMAFELKNLSFAYPGSKKTSNALDGINLTIPGGSLVVIVGSNGSGKSTIVKILSRLFNPTSGELLIDGRPAQDYHLSDLRRATAILSQDNKVYPLSFAENIGLGCLDSIDDMELIKKAAEQGGASEFISKLETGYDTTLKPYTYSTSMNIYGKEDHPLHKEMEKLEKTLNISGGETQRLVAARSFMRFNSGKVKFVAVDEPSSALDAEGELKLFNNLIEARKGKTMVFVTHRFGHLTKFADTIICMKDGKIAETGSHEKLMELDGEYAKLFKIQANAFSESGKESEPSPEDTVFWT